MYKKINKYFFYYLHINNQFQYKEYIIIKLFYIINKSNKRIKNYNKLFAKYNQQKNKNYKILKEYNRVGSKYNLLLEKYKDY